MGGHCWVFLFRPFRASSLHTCIHWFTLERVSLQKLIQVLCTWNTVIPSGLHLLPQHRVHLSRGDKGARARSEAVRWHRLHPLQAGRRKPERLVSTCQNARPGSASRRPPDAWREHPALTQRRIWFQGMPSLRANQVGPERGTACRWKAGEN